MARQPSSKTIAIDEIAVFEGLSIHSRKPAIRMSLECSPVEPALLKSAEQEIHSLIDEAMVVANVDDRDGRSAPTEGSANVSPPSAAAALAARVALRLQHLHGHDVGFTGQGLPANDQGHCHAVFEHIKHPVDVLAGRTAVTLINAALASPAHGQGSNTSKSLHDTLNGFLKAVSSYSDQIVTSAILWEAEKRDIPYSYLLSGNRLLQLGQGRKIQRFHNLFTKSPSYLATKFATNKAMASSLLRSHDIPAAANIVTTTPDQAVAAANRLGYPLVVKPNTTDFGTAVSVNLTTEDSVRKAFRLARRHGDVVVEQYIPGNHHRLSVIHGHVLAASLLKPAHVTGNGRHTITELVKTENQNRTAVITDHFKKMKLDEESVQMLKEQGYTLDDIPPKGTEVLLRRQSNLSQGGTREDVTSKVHPENRAMAERAVRLVGLDVAGVDFTSTDVSKPYYLTGGAICEINPTPAVSRHRPDLWKALMDEYFPPGDNGRIPTAAITGSHGAAMTARVLSQLLSQAGYVTGVATKDEALIDGVRVAVGDFSGVRGCKAVLGDPCVGAAVIETSCANILKQGFGFDRCNVSAVMASPGEPDQDLSIEDIVRAKELTIDAARDLTVIGADDPHFEALMQRAGDTPVCVVSLDPPHPNAIRHREGGGITMLLDTQKGKPLVTHWQAGSLAGTYASETITGLQSADNAEALTSACFACGLAVGLGVTLGEPS